MWRIFLTICLLCWSADGQVREVRCRNERDEPVDWYIIYKRPEDPQLEKYSTEGLEYLYIDSKGKKKETSKDHNKLIDNPDGVLANTLKHIFKPNIPLPKDFGFITYNDQPPDGKGAGCNFGHSKGVVMMDKTTGVWLSHSTPRFPFTRDQNDFYPDSGAANAQTFICVTFKYDQFKKIGQHLLDIRAFPFDHQIPKDTNANFHRELIQVTEKNNSPGEGIRELTSDAGTPFRSFAKKQYTKPTTTTTTYRKDSLKDSKRFDGDLYLTIAKGYTTIKKSNTDVRVQTWGQQCYREGSYCEQNQRQVINIKSVKADLGYGEVEWEPCHDHSKWCVGKDNNNNLICIADVNRAVTQYERPGGALCFEHQQASDLFKVLIGGTKNCPIGGSKRPASPSTLQSSKKTKTSTSQAASATNTEPDCDK